MKEISAILQTTYANLLQAHLNRPSFEFEGAPFLRALNNKKYWYANHRSTPGAPLKQRYIGPDSDEMRKRVSEMQAYAQGRADFREHASGLIAQLRAGGIAGPDRKTGPILRALTNSGVFRLGGILVGTHAFRHYDLVLGVHLSDTTGWITQTDDIDIASFENFSMAIEDTADPDLADALTKLGFNPAPSLTPKTPTSWTLPDASYAIDFLTPSFRDDEKPIKLAALNMWAQGLHYLNFLIEDSIDAVSPYMEGLLIRIPRPERYAIHKLIISQRRRKASNAKARKDIEQARSIIWAMAGHLDHEVRATIADADARGDKWQQALDRALDLQIAPTDPIRPGDSAEFFGEALGATVRLRISGSALMQLYGDDSLETARAQRPAIGKMFRQYFRKQPGPDILLTSYNLPSPD